MSGVTLVACTRIEIGDGTMLGAEAMIFDTDFHPIDARQREIDPCAGAVSRPVVVGRNVFIGARAIILKGVTIGDGAVIGAGAVIVKDVAAGDVVAGNPARVVGSALHNSRKERSA
jgi:acetyltransferase-like isoleucine patch superfamily enzyme